MKNRFIVLIDFSPYSEHLLRFAYDWSRRAHAEMLVVHHTFPLMPVMTPFETKKNIIDSENKDAGRKLREFTKANLPGVKPVKHLVSEKSLLIILRQLLEEPFNNIVFLGIKGKGLLKKIFIGSQAVNIIDGIDNLIVAIPLNSACCAPDAIHVAVQKSYPLNIIEFNKFLRLTQEETSKIIFFSVIMPGDDRDATEKYLKELIELFPGKRDVSYELYIGENGLKDLKEKRFIRLMRTFSS